MGEPSQVELDALFARAARVRVIEGGVLGGDPLGDRTRLQLDGADVAALGAALRIHEGREGFHCMCRGDWAVELRDGAGARVATIGLHHGQSLRLDGWTSDAWLATPDAVLDLLAARGLDEPRAETLAARAAAGADAERHARWIGYRPRALAAFHGRLDDGTLGLPRHRSHAVWPEVAAALVATEGGEVGAAYALLAWLATSESPWSGYPAEESVPLTLLDLLGPEAIVAATDRAPRPIAIAAARALAMGSWSRRRLREAVAPIADHLTAAVAIRSPDDQARLAAVLRPAPSIVGTGDLVLVGATDHEPASALAVETGAVLACDGPELIAFGAGGERHLLHALSGGHVELAADDGRVLVADMKAERVTLIHPEAAEVAVLAEQEGRPMHPRLLGDRAIWLSCPYENRPGETSLQWTHVRVHTPEAGTRTLASWTEPATWDACLTDDGVALVARTTERGLFRTTQVAHLRLVRWDGAIRQLATLADPCLDGEHVRLAFAYEDFFWTGRARRELWTCAADGGQVRRAATLPGDPIALTADARGAVVIVRVDDACVVLDCAHRREPAELMRYQAAVWARPHVVCDAHGVVFAVGHEVVRVPRCA